MEQDRSNRSVSHVPEVDQHPPRLDRWQGTSPSESHQATSRDVSLSGGQQTLRVLLFGAYR